MREEARFIHRRELQKELQVAEYHVAHGKEIIEQQRKRVERLRSVSGNHTLPTQNADTLLQVAEDSQKILEGHVDLLKHEIATET